MEFHPKKCQVLHVTNKRNIIKASYNIHGHILEETDSAKYLGVNIHHKLSWNHHIQKVTSKANSTRAFLQRNIHQCPRETKVLCYKTLLRPVIEYASIIWDPHTNANISRLEMIQRRYARFVFHDYRRSSSVSAMACLTSCNGHIYRKDEHRLKLKWCSALWMVWLIFPHHS